MTPSKSAQETRSRMDMSCLAEQSINLFLLLICRLMVPRSGTPSPRCDGKVGAGFLEVDPQRECYGDVYSKHKLVYMLISHL